MELSSISVCQLNGKARPGNILAGNRLFNFAFILGAGLFQILVEQPCGAGPDISIAILLPLLRGDSRHGLWIVLLEIDIVHDSFTS